MAKRLSNRQRIERMAEEASIKTEETSMETEDKKPKPTVRKASGSRKTSPARKRMKFIWKVVDANAKEIASFPYREEREAQARAADLSAKTGKTHTVNRVRVPMEDNE